MTNNDRTDRPVGSDAAPDPLTKPRLKKRPSMFEPPTGKDWDTLSADEKIAKFKELQQVVLRKEAEIIRLIKLRDAGARRQLPPGVLEDAMKVFEVGDRRIQQLMVEYEEYRQTYKDDPSAEYFMPLPL